MLDLHAQLDREWMIGWIGKMKFTGSTYQYTQFADTIKIDDTNASICDTTGSLLFWSNGSVIFQNNRDTMQNGILFHLPFSQNYVSGGMIIIQGAIALPKPNDNQKYYLFHSSLGYYSSSPPNYQFRASNYISEVDMSANGGLGSVTLNSQFLEDSLQSGNMTAVKHANGRDWWLISHEIASNTFYEWLITPGGISTPFKYSVGSSLAGHLIGQLSFSPDGNYLAMPIGYGGATVRIEVFSFDRCSGNLNGLVKTDFFTTPNQPEFLGTQFSPSNRFLYLSTSESLFQYDMLAANFTNSRILIDTYNGTLAPSEALITLMKLAPDGKIYSHSYNGNWTLHVINSPDSLGISCDFVQNQFYPLNSSLYIVSLPNQPNYNLGTLPGSPCDTLLSQNEVTSLLFSDLSVHYLPSSQSVTIKAHNLKSTSYNLSVYDLLGNVIFNEVGKLNPPYFTKNLNCTAFAKGMYVVVLQTDIERLTKKFVVE